MPEPFTFGIPLIARRSAGNWPLVEALLDLTLASILAQSDQSFRIVIAGHDRPALPSGAGFEFIAASWSPEPVRPDNLDSGRKKFLIQSFVLETGGGLLMLLDADDWVDVGLVRLACQHIGPDAIGGYIPTGFATDFRTLNAAAIPDRDVFDGPFQRLCGSCAIARLDPGASDPLRRDPFAVVHEHYRWPESAEALGASLVPLPAKGNYVVNTTGNHSETHSPFKAWRRHLNHSINSHGRAVDDSFLSQFGLSLGRVRETSERFA
jgi:hypothetical protein